MFVDFMNIWNNLRPFGIISGRLVWFVVIWYIFPIFGMFGPRKIWQPCLAQGELEKVDLFSGLDP
jgi:hypothetical protein